MSAGTITFKAGRRERQDDYKDFSGPDGVYRMTLVSVSAPYEADSSFTKTGKQTYRDWVLAISDGGPHDGEVLDIRATVSTSDKSKQYEIVSALIGRSPALGVEVDIDRHLVGRDALANIQTNDNDFPYIKALMPAPQAAAPAAQPAPAPAPAPVPVAAGAPAASDDGLPF